MRWWRGKREFLYRKIRKILRPDDVPDPEIDPLKNERNMGRKQIYVLLYSPGTGV